MIVHRIKVIEILRVIVNFDGFASFDDMTLVYTLLGKLAALDTSSSPVLPVTLVLGGGAELRSRALFILGVRLKNNMLPDRLDQVALFRYSGDLHIMQLLLITVEVL